MIRIPRSTMRGSIRGADGGTLLWTRNSHERNLFSIIQFLKVKVKKRFLLYIIRLKAKQSWILSFLKIAGADVVLKSYEPTPEGLIQSWMERYTGDSAFRGLDYCWRKDKPFFWITSGEFNYSQLSLILSFNHFYNFLVF